MHFEIDESSSHVLDLLAELAHRPLAYHGAQVAVATLLGAASYESFLQHFDPSRIDPNRCYPPMSDMQQRVESTFLSKDPSGKAGSECWHDYAQKLHAWHAHRPEFEAFLRDWSTLKPELAKRARTVADITHIMRAVDLPLRFEALTPPTSLADAEFAYWSAPLMRKRLTLGDVLLYIGWDRAAIWQRFAS